MSVSIPLSFCLSVRAPVSSKPGFIHTCRGPPDVKGERNEKLIYGWISSPPSQIGFPRFPLLSSLVPIPRSSIFPSSSYFLPLFSLQKSLIQIIVSEKNVWVYEFSFSFFILFPFHTSPLHFYPL